MKKNIDIDCHGLCCPVHIALIFQAMRKLTRGDTVTIVANDPSFRNDIEAWTRKTGHTLVSYSEGDGRSIAVLAHK